MINKLDKTMHTDESCVDAASLTEDPDVYRVGWKGVDDGRVNPAVTRPRAADHQSSRLGVQQSAVCEGPFIMEKLAHVIKSILNIRPMDVFTTLSPIRPYIRSLHRPTCKHTIVITGAVYAVMISIT